MKAPAKSHTTEQIKIQMFKENEHRTHCTFLTWLILPVVICLFQRLSHASLSISFYTAKLRIAHYKSYNLRDDNC